MFPTWLESQPSFTPLIPLLRLCPSFQREVRDSMLIVDFSLMFSLKQLVNNSFMNLAKLAGQKERVLVCELTNCRASYGANKNKISKLNKLTLFPC